MSTQNATAPTLGQRHLARLPTVRLGGIWWSLESADGTPLAGGFAYNYRRPYSAPREMIMAGRSGGLHRVERSKSGGDTFVYRMPDV